MKPTTSRREFLARSATYSLGAIFIPKFLRAKKEWPLLGQGDFTYRVMPDWGLLNPSMTRVKDCHEMVQDKKGRLILFTNETANNILIFDKSGKLLHSWGKEYPGAHGLTLSEEGDEEFLYLTDHDRHQVIKTTLEGRVLMTLDHPEETGFYPTRGWYKPTETAIGPNGDIYVADGYGVDYIHQYDAKGNLIRSFGGPTHAWLVHRAKSHPGKFPAPTKKIAKDRSRVHNAHGVTLDTRDPNNPSLLVTSRIENKLKRFSLEGEFISDIPIPGAFVNRAVVKGKHIYASVLRSDRPSRDGTGFVTILDENNQVVSNPGGTAPVYQGKKLQQIEQQHPVFVHPHDVCVDDDENLYVPQWNSGKTFPIKLIRV
ncbi:MAG: 6-bladed beta-propeller [Bacteroidota bacterium]